jgi:hypothetical protein
MMGAIDDLLNCQFLCINFTSTLSGHVTFFIDYHQEFVGRLAQSV